MPTLQIRAVALLELLARPTRARVVTPDIRPVLAASSPARDAWYRTSRHRLAERRALPANVYRRLGTYRRATLRRFSRRNVERRVGALFFAGRHVLEHSQRVVPPGRRGGALYETRRIPSASMKALRD